MYEVLPIHTNHRIKSPSPQLQNPFEEIRIRKQMGEDNQPTQINFPLKYKQLAISSNR